jgi:hypothetical protein
MNSGGQICWQSALQTSIYGLFLQISCLDESYVGRCIESLVIGFLP